MEQTAFAPRDERGCFLPAVCPECGDLLVFEPGDRIESPSWRCTGLVDPENDALPLEACMFMIGSYWRESSHGLREQRPTTQQPRTP
jgi:hypothetical protein